MNFWIPFKMRFYSRLIKDSGDTLYSLIDKYLRIQSMILLFFFWWLLKWVLMSFLLSFFWVCFESSFEWILVWFCYEFLLGLFEWSWGFNQWINSRPLDENTTRFIIQDSLEFVKFFWVCLDKGIEPILLKPLQGYLYI